MRKDEIQRLGNRIFARSIEPLRRHAVYDGTIMGFDTEYDSKTHKLLSYQLYYKDRGVFIPRRRMSVDTLVKDAIALCGFVPERLLLVAYFSLAELQFFDVKGAALAVREFARGSLDVTFVPAKYKYTEVEVYDLARWFDFVGLGKAAKAFGMEKLDYKTTKVTAADLKKKKFREYGIHDAKLCHDIAHELRTAFLERGVDIVTARTPASASASVFRLHHLREDERFYCDKNRARLAACYGTWGGRAEVFKRGRLRGQYVENDIRSAYPRAVLQLRNLPVQNTWHECRNAACMDRDKGGFARVRFRFGEDCPYPCLPVPSEKGTMLYPLRGESWATFAEVKLARETGAKVKTVEAWGYRKGTTALADYMDECLALRKKAVGGARQMYKLMANSLVGKFAQRSDRLNISALYDLAEAIGLPIDELVQMSYLEIKTLAEEARIKIERFTLGSVWMPEWNGLITGHTRAVLGRAILSVKDPVYCHTDSVWARNANGLDKEDWETKGRGKCTVARTRFAALWTDPPKIAHHSIWSRKVAEQMLRKFTGKTDIKRKYPKTRPLKFREAVKRGQPVGRWIGKGDPGYWRTGDTKWDYKRKLFPDGHTEPWRDLREYVEFIESIR